MDDQPNPNGVTLLLSPAARIDASGQKLRVIPMLEGTYK
jgi:hypothetical protein